jgi:O-methyltransferase involved in polyketide biosynthesis
MVRPNADAKVKVDLGGVPETLLWNLYFRASEARRPDTVLSDPKAVELIDAIDFPFEERFGRANALQAQAQALRVRAFDLEVERFLARHPDATVVALGEGLETQAWRVDNGQVRWLTVELPETARLRRALLPDSPRQRIVACSAFDYEWMERVDTSHAVLITAQGLLMYFHPAEVYQLIECCAERFAGGTMLFDVVPRWFSQRTLNDKMVGDRGYKAPPMPWGVGSAELAQLRALPHVASLHELSLPSGRGFIFGRITPALSHIGLQRCSPSVFFAPWIILRAEFRA